MIIKRFKEREDTYMTELKDININNKKNYIALLKWSAVPTITVIPVSTNNESILLISVLKLKELLQLKHKNKVEIF